MNKNSFSEDDTKKLVQLLNMIAKNAKFEVSVNELIDFYKLLSFVQSELIPKINENVLEVLAVKEAPSDESEDI